MVLALVALAFALVALALAVFAASSSAAAVSRTARMWLEGAIEGTLEESTRLLQFVDLLVSFSHGHQGVGEIAV